jgi:hypothetical protein
MKAIEFKNLCVGLCVGAAAVFAMGAAPQEHKPIEYKVVSGDIWTGDFQKKLNDIAPEGWQLQKAESFAERYGFAILTRSKQ